MTLKLKTAPLIEPLTMSEVYAHLRIDSDEEDELIESYIKTAREYCEGFQNRAYINTVYELWLDEFPCDDEITFPVCPIQEPAITAGSFVSGTVYRILIVGNTDFTLIGASANTVGVIFTATGAGSGTGTATVSGIIKYYGTDNTEYFMSGSDLYLATHSEPGCIALAYGKSWPSTTLREKDAVCVTFTAGYGTAASSIPQKVKQAMMLLIADYYAYREAKTAGESSSGNASSQTLQAVHNLLWFERSF